MRVKKQQLELDMEQLTGSKSGKEYDKVVYCHPGYLINMQRTSCEIQGWLSHKLESRLLGEISTTSDMHIWCYCSVAQSCLALCDPMDCSTPGFPVLHHLLEFAPFHVHWINDAIQSSHPLSPRSLPALNLSQHQGVFQWIHSWHQVAKVLELQLQHQSFKKVFRVDFP